MRYQGQSALFESVELGEIQPTAVFVTILSGNSPASEEASGEADGAANKGPAQDQRLEKAEP